MIPALSTGAADAPKAARTVSSPLNPNLRESFFPAHGRTNHTLILLPRIWFLHKKNVVTIKCDNNTVIGRQMLKTSALSFSSEKTPSANWAGNFIYLFIFLYFGIKLIDQKYISWK